ncbi:MAG: hypothetical protein K8L99_30160 [Anaerolineae bacterium]|nr:hypothetical protein [Anaerolineae bacterium]
MMDDMERLLEQNAAHFPYPPTPRLNIPNAHKPTPVLLPRLVMLLLAVVIGSLLLIEPLRASVLDILRIGVIDVLIGEPPPATVLPPESLINLAGEMTLEQASQRLGFTLRLPPEFGLPDHVYLQDADGRAAVLVWLNPDDPHAILLSLYEFAMRGRAYGKLVDVAQNIQVNGQPAAWIGVPHVLQYQAGDNLEERQSFLVEHNVLIWADADGITYRLESEFSMERAVEIAESLR